MAENTLDFGNVISVKRDDDSNAPFSFVDWVKRNSNVGELDRYDEYRKYVSSWRSQKDEETDVKARILKDYQDFIRSVYPYIDNTDTFNTDELDLDSNLSIELLIPVFTKRIKSIMMYFIDKRISVTRSKLKYNMHGSYMSIERMLHEWLLSNYTIRKNRIPSVKNVVEGRTIPTLGDVNTKIVVRVDEYYDDQNYADKNPALGASAYFTDVSGYAANSADPTVASLYGKWNTPDGGSDIIWLFDGGLNERKLDNPIYYSIRDAVLGTSALDEYEAEKESNRYVYDLTRKYLGNDYGYISGGYYKEDWRDFEYNFRSGNNYFYFPSGGNDAQPNDLQIEPVNINFTTLSANAHGADNYEDADRIFVRQNGNLKGAWLRKLHRDWVEKNMVVSVPMKLGYSFAYPLAGYGTSGDGIEWSGPLYESNHPLYMALDEGEREVVKAQYWNNLPDGYECSSMSVQRFTIADNEVASALGGSAFLDSMHMSIRPVENNSESHSVYNGNLDHIWLFEPKNTEFVVSECKNYYEFPHFTLAGMGDHSNFFDIRWCDDVPLSSVGTASAFRGGNGGSCPANSDIIYKIDDAGRAIEAAWLSAVPVKCMYFTSGDPNRSTWEHDEVIREKQRLYEEALSAIDGWRGLEFVSKYSLVYPHIPFADYCCESSGLFMKYEYAFTVNPGEDEYFMYTGWTPFDNRSEYGNASPGGPFISALFLGDSPRPEFATVPYYDGCEDYDYIYPCADYPYIDTVEDRKKIAFYYKDGQWHGGDEYTSTVAWGENPQAVIVKNVLYKYHRSKTATAPGVFRIINEAFEQTVETTEEGDGKPRVTWTPAVYTKWIKMTRDAYTNEWIDVGKETDMVLRSGDRIVYDAIKSTRVVCKSQYLGYDDYEFIFNSIPWVIKIGLENARPYWAESVTTDTEETGWKAVDVHSNGIRWVDSCFLLNPPISDKVVEPLDRISVYSDIPFVWEQPVWVKEPHDDVAWCKIDATYHDVDLSSVYGNDHVVRDFYDKYIGADVSGRTWGIQSGVISAIPTEEASDIEFGYTDGDQMLINYWAANNFTWNPRFLNVKNGVPPTGGIYVPYGISESGVEAIVPWANLGNRHYPSMAIVPDLSHFYRKEDVGGYFLPQNLGVSEAVTKDPVLYVDASRRSEEENAIDPISVGESFAQDDGFTKGRENPGIYVRKEHLDWAKVPIGVGSNAGMRKDDNLVQSFVPYMTSEEARGGFYNTGIQRPNDVFDPWKPNGSYDWDDIKNGKNYKEHITRQQPIERWAGDRFVKHEVAVSKEDVYGFNYVLVKNMDEGDCIYEQRGRHGHVYYRGFDDSYHNLHEVSKLLSQHPVTYCGMITDIDVAYDVFYAVGYMPEDPIRAIRESSGVLDTWCDWFDSSANCFPGGIAESVTPFDVYVQDKKESDVPPLTKDDEAAMNLRPIFNVCYWRFIKDTMNTLADTYNIEEFRRVGDGCDNPYDTFYQLQSNIERLYDSIRENFADVVYSLPVADEWYPWRVKDENGLVVKDYLADILNAMEDSQDDDNPHPKNTAYGLIWHLVEVCRRLMMFHLFREGVGAYFVFPIRVSEGEDSPTIDTVIGKIVIQEDDFPVRYARPWFLPDRRKYIIPAISLRDNLLSATFDMLDTEEMGRTGWTRISATDSCVYDKVTSEVSASLSSQLASEWLISPVAAYNDKTENMVLLQQVSAEHSEVGPIAVYNFNYIDSTISGTTIVPCNVEGEFDTYVEENRKYIEPETPPKDDEKYVVTKVSFVDTGYERIGINVYDYFTGDDVVYFPWHKMSSSFTPSAVVTVGAMLGYNCPVVNGSTKMDNGVGTLDERYPNDLFGGVYMFQDETKDDEFRFDTQVQDGTSGYIRWNRAIGAINIYPDDFSVCTVAYSRIDTDAMMNMVEYENRNSVISIPSGITLEDRDELLAWSSGLFSNGVTSPGEMTPSIGVSTSDGFEVSGYIIGNEHVNSSDTDLDLYEYASGLRSGDSVWVKTKRKMVEIQRFLVGDLEYSHEDIIMDHAIPSVGYGDNVTFGCEVYCVPGSPSETTRVMTMETWYGEDDRHTIPLFATTGNDPKDILTRVDIVCGEQKDTFILCSADDEGNRIPYTDAITKEILNGNIVEPFTLSSMREDLASQSNEVYYDITNFALSHNEIYLRFYWDESQEIPGGSHDAQDEELEEEP